MITLKNHISTVVAAFILMLLPLSYAGAETNQTELGTLPMALAGYDVTTYYTSGGPQAGAKAHQAVYQKQRYLFTSKENQQSFAADPKKYLPKFGEHCAFALSQKVSRKADPAVFTITEGNLMLFSNQEMLANWHKDEAENFAKAEKFAKYEHSYNADKRLREDTRVRLLSF